MARQNSVDRAFDKAAPPKAGIGHYVYILRCADRSLYIGYARDPHARERVHNGGHGARYTSGRRPVRLVYAESFESVGDALRREHELKRWSKAKKEALVRSAPGKQASPRETEL